MGRKPKDPKDVKKKFAGCWVTEEEYAWIQRKDNISAYIRMKTLEDYDKEKQEVEIAKAAKAVAEAIRKER